MSPPAWAPQPKPRAVQLGGKAHCSFPLSLRKSGNQSVTMETSPPIRGKHFLVAPAPPTHPFRPGCVGLSPRTALGGQA